jgi:hypothetical protein
MVKFLLEEAGCPKPTTNIACLNADEDYDVEILPSFTIVHRAVRYKNLPVLQYLLETGHELDVNDVSLCDEAVLQND